MTNEQINSRAKPNRNRNKTKEKQEQADVTEKDYTKVHNPNTFIAGMVTVK